MHLIGKQSISLKPIIMPRSLFVYMLVLGLGLTACDQKKDFTDKSLEPSEVEILNANGNKVVSAQQTAQQSTTPTNTYASERKVIKKGNISFTSDNLDATEVVIKTALSANGGYISEETSNESDYNASRKMIVRIPAAQFDVFLKDISDKAGKLESKNITTEDVTTEFLDLTAHIRIKQALEERYYELLQHCKTMDAIIQMEKQLNEVRTEIETAQGRLNYLSGLTTYSTLTISFYAPNTYIAEKPTFGAKIKTAFGNGWKFILQFIISITTIWPLFIFVVLGWYGYRFIKRKMVVIK
jgi:hypothetical protein